jgi:hypothetical protein
MKKVDKETYDKVVKSVPEHDKKVLTRYRSISSPLYVWQRIFDEEENLVAMHDEDGVYWVDDFDDEGNPFELPWEEAGNLD